MHVHVFVRVHARAALRLTDDVEPMGATAALHHDDAHHVSDGLRLHHSESEVWLVKGDWLSRWRWAGHPLHVQPSCGGA